MLTFPFTGSNTHNNGGNGGDGQSGSDGEGKAGQFLVCPRTVTTCAYTYRRGEITLRRYILNVVDLCNVTEYVIVRGYREHEGGCTRDVCRVRS